MVVANFHDSCMREILLRICGYVFVFFFENVDLSKGEKCVNSSSGSTKIPFFTKNKETERLTVRIVRYDSVYATAGGDFAYKICFKYF